MRWKTTLPRASWEREPGQIFSKRKETATPVSKSFRPSFRKKADRPERGILLFFLLLCCFIGTPIFTEAVEVLEQEDVSIHHTEDLRGAAEELAGAYPRLKAELESVIQWKLDVKPTLFLTKDSKAFQEIVGTSVIAAYALPQRNLIAIDYSKMRIPPFYMEGTVKHELSHLLLHQHIKGGSLPKWLDEGIAQWVSGGLSEIILERKRSVLNEAVLTKKIIPIRFLADSFPGEPNLLLLAYEESKSFVEYVRDNYGEEGVLGILNALKNGDTINEAVHKALAISFADLEQRWLRRIKQRASWFSYLSRNLYEILFLAAAIVTIVGFIKYLLKRRAYQDEWDDG